MARKHEATVDHVKEAQERIAAEVDKLMATERWQRCLKLQARFHHYSFGNMLLIMSQCENPTYIKGFKGWLDMGRVVTKGETSIRILAPKGRCIRTETNDQGEDEIVASWQRFGTVSVFDVSQTAPLPDHPRPFDPSVDMRPWSGALESGDPMVAWELLERLVEHVRADGCTVTMTIEGHPTAAGYYQPTGDVLWIKERERCAMFSTAVHEVAHRMTHKALGMGASSTAHEIVAESIAFIVCDYFGIESTVPSAEYLAHWMAKDMKTARQTFPHIQKCAAELIDTLVGAMAPTA